MTVSETPVVKKAAFVIERVFDAPLARVWQVWTEAEELKHWWGPKGCSIEVLRLEFRPGGFFHYSMDYQNAPRSYGRFNYREIVPQERIVWLNSFSNEKCGITRAPFSEDCPLEMENYITFAERNGSTLVTLRADAFGETETERIFWENLQPSLQNGYGGTFDMLAEYLGRS